MEKFNPDIQACPVYFHTFWTGSSSCIDFDDIVNDFDWRYGVKTIWNANFHKFDNIIYDVTVYEMIELI